MAIEITEQYRSAVIYQVNVRQFSKNGQFEDIIERLDDIVQLGATIIWLMPIHPIGLKNRKGTLGSPYSISDYFAVNPELGNQQQLHTLIEECHRRNLTVILDWVANHSAWDNALVSTHPSWYAKDHKGQLRSSRWWDWDDIVEFDYSQPELRQYMVDAMCYWLREFDIDGFRCDVAGYVPLSFWQKARDALTAIKPVFLLAEWESRDLHSVFEASYALSWYDALHNIAHQRAGIDRLRSYYAGHNGAWPAQALRMTFVSNHDKNAWDGTQSEQFRHLLIPAIVLSVIGEGVPLIYSGQECGESKRLAFFEQDPIDWQAHSIGELYAELIAIMKQYTVLHHLPFGQPMIPVKNSAPEQVFSFARQTAEQQIVVCLNLSAEPVAVRFDDAWIEDCDYQILKGESFQADKTLLLPVGGFTIALKQAL